MTNPLFPLLDGLANTGQIFLDNAVQKNWSEIEDLEKEQGSLEAHAKQQRAGTALTSTTGTSAFTDAVIRTQPVSHPDVDATPSLFEKMAENGFDPVSFGDVEDGEQVDAARDNRPASAARSLTPGHAAPAATAAQTGAASGVPGGEWQTLGEAASSSATITADGSGRMIETAATGIDHSLASSGSFVAAQKLHAAVRSLSPEQVSILLDKAGGAIAAMFERTVRGEDGGGRAEERQREVRIALSLAHVAAAIDKDPRNPSSMRLVQDICAIVLASAAPNDNTTFSGLAQAIGVGAGARLALAVATHLAHHDEDPSRAPALMTLVLAGFVRLGERVDDAYAEVLKHTGPLCLEWFKWRGEGQENALRALVNALKAQPAYLERLAPQLERLEQAGLEAFRAVRDLAVYTSDRNFREVHERFLANPSVFAAIAGSRTALKDIRHLSLVTNGGQGGPVLEAVRLTLTQIGFDAPRAAFLADLGQLGSDALMLGANWTELDDFEFMEMQGRAFQRLLAFLNGQYVLAETPETIGFDDADMQV